MKPLSIRVGLTVWFVAVTMLLLGGFSVTLYSSLARALHRGLDEQLATKAQALVELCDWDEDYRRPEFGQSESPAAGKVAAGSGFDVWWWPQRKLLHSSGYPLPKLAADAAFADHPRPLQQLTTVEGDEPVRVCTLLAVVPAVAASLDDPAKPAFEVLARASESLAPVDARLARVAWQIWGLVGLSALVVIAFGVWLSWRFVRPIERLGNAAAAVRAGNAAKMPRRGSDDEVDRLAAILDSTFASLDETLHRQERFTANAAHELRNPMTVIRNAAEVALRNDRSPAEYREFLGDVLATSERVSSIIEGLLTLARADAGVLRTRFCEVDLLQIAQESAAALAKSPGRVVVRNGTGAVLRGEPRLLRVLTDNLLSNALRYSDGAAVELHVATDERGAVSLAVRDFGPGVPAEARARVFERFFRVEGTRGEPSARGEPAGAGLGLSIVAEVARVHSADCTLEDAAPGTRVTVRFPPASS